MTLHPGKTSPTHGLGRLDWEAENKNWVATALTQAREGRGVGLQPARRESYSRGLEQLLPLHKSGKGGERLQQWEPIAAGWGQAWRRVTAAADIRRRVWNEVFQNNVVLMLKKKLIEPSNSEGTDQFNRFDPGSTYF